MDAQISKVKSKWSIIVFSCIPSRSTLVFRIETLNISKIISKCNNIHIDSPIRDRMFFADAQEH